MRRLRNRDRGSIVPLVPIVLLALFLLGGLLVDGSRYFNIRANAQAYAEEAARAGASAVDFRSNTLHLNLDGGPGSVQAMVTSYCDGVRKNENSSITVVSCGLNPPQTQLINEAVTPTPTCGGVMAQILVHTEVTLRINTTLLGMIGFQTLTGTGQAYARPYEGTPAGGDC